jgi:3-oxoadipate enol-lactonase
MEGGAQRIDVGGHDLRTEVAGSGPPDWLCLHGLVDRLEIWDQLWEPLARRGRVMRVDQRGHGKSDAPAGPYRRQDLAADAATLLDTLGSERAVLVGHSMGGIVSMATALDHPDRVVGLVLIGTASQCSEKVAGWYERIARAGERDGTAGLARAIYGERTRKQVTGDARGIAHVTRTLKSLHDDPLTPKLGNISCPVLLLVGESDPMGPRASEIIAERLPNARLEVVPNSGHWLHVEQPEAVLRALDAWIPTLSFR